MMSETIANHEQRCAPRWQLRGYDLGDRVVEWSHAGNRVVVPEAVNCNDATDGALVVPCVSDLQGVELSAEKQLAPHVEKSLETG